jgi:hypothetical protein
MTVHLDCLEPSQGTAGDERPSEGSSGSIWGAVTMRMAPGGKKAGS